MESRNKALIIAVFVAFCVLLAGCTANPQDVFNKLGANLSANMTNGTNGTVLTLAEVATHDNASDCWMIISGNVYDLTSYMAHPGGEGFKSYCGKDATAAYNTKSRPGNGTPHSGYADALLNDYFIGKLGGNAAATQNSQNLSIPKSNATDGETIQNESNLQQTTLTLNLAEVSKHDNASDCWMIISGNVYDLTSYVSHPGGSGFKAYCGTDASQAYDTKDGRGKPHSSYADSLLTNYLIGALNETVMYISATPVATGDDFEWDYE